MVAVPRFRAFLRRESEAAGLPLGWILGGAAVVHLAVTLLSVNPWHADEHFQVLEFAWARAGLAPLADLPWEWDARIRPTLQPVLAMGVLGALRAVGVESPFVWIALLRVGTLALAFATLLRVFAVVGPSLEREGRRALWLSGLLLWFTPLLLFRFTSENLAAMALAWALTLVAAGRQPGDAAAEGTPGGAPARPAPDVLAGVLLGLAFVFRFQTAFAAAAILAWMAVRGDGGRAVARMVGGAAVVVAVGTAVDAWFYGTWLLTPLNYVRVNVMEGVASTFGTSPWYGYGVGAPMAMAPPLGLVVAILVVAALVGFPASPWSWAFLAFFLGHSVVPHKELRFLFPLLYLLPVLVGRGVHLVAGAAGGIGGWRRGVAWLLAVQNVTLLALVVGPTFRHGREMDGHFALWLWKEAGTGDGPVYVLDEGGDPYLVYGNPANVVRHPRVVGVAHQPGDPIPRQVPAGTPPERLLLVTRGDAPPSVAGATVGDTAYRSEPGHRILARSLGMPGAAWLPWLDRVTGWTDDPEQRTVFRVRRDGQREGRAP